jgi:hypothetical protein
MHLALPRLRAVVCLWFSLLLTCQAGSAADTSLTVQIRGLQSARMLPTPLQFQSTEHLIGWLQSKGIGVADKASRIFWCDVYTLEGTDSNNVVLSVGLGQALPSKVLEWGKKEEILYSSMPVIKKSKLPKEGKWVRESLSEDFLYEYIQPIDHVLVIVDKPHLFKRIDEIAELLYQRHFKH